jgi:hypothetical protein
MKYCNYDRNKVGTPKYENILPVSCHLWQALLINKYPNSPKTSHLFNQVIVTLSMMVYEVD